MIWWLILVGFISKSVNRFNINDNHAVRIPDIFKKDFDNDDKKKDKPESIMKTEKNLEKIIKSRNNKNKFTYGNGEDGRPKQNDTIPDDFVLLNITEFIMKMNLLTLLENDQVSLHEKMNAINKYKKDTDCNDCVLNIK